MSKYSHAAQNIADLGEKDSSSGSTLKVSSKEFFCEAQTEESECNQGNVSKSPSHFDVSNLSVFFSNLPAPSKSSAEPKVHAKKKSNDALSNKDTSLKQTTLKDFGIPDDLFENTTILSGNPETKGHAKRISNDFPLLKSQAEEIGDNSNALSPDNTLLKQPSKMKSQEKSFSTVPKQPKEERSDQEFVQNNSKLSVNNELEETEKAENSFLKDTKPSKSNFDIKVIERIKSKVNYKPSANTSGQSDSLKTTQTPVSETRNNNNSLFTGPNKVAKAGNSNFGQGSKTPDEDDFDTNNEILKQVNNLLEDDKKEDDDSDEMLLFSPFSNKATTAQNYEFYDEQTPFPTPRIDALGRHSVQSKPTFLLGDNSINPTPIKSDTSFNNKIKTRSNLSLISTDSTIESDTIGNNFDHHNNSFSTHFSSNSFNNSAKLDFNSPARLDSGRDASDFSSAKKNSQMMNPNQKFPLMYQQKVPPHLNHSSLGFYGGGYGSGNTSDRSNSLSYEDLVNSAFSSNFSTPQGRHQQNFVNQSFNGMPNQKLMDHHQFFMVPQSMTPQNYPGKMGGNFGNFGNMQVPERKSFPSAKMNHSFAEPKNGAGRMRRKTQDNEDHHNFEVDIDKIESSGRTTLMIKNIPNKYDLTLILQTIDKNHKGKYDFFYLPIDFRNKCNVGYAFINFVEPKYIKDFYHEFNGKKWEKFNSEKICEIKYARIQGQEALIQHFQYSSVMNQQDKKLKPYIPPKYEIANKEKIEELVERQKRQSGKNQNEGL